VLLLGSVGSNNNVNVMDIYSLIGNLINDRVMGFHLVLMVQMYSRYELLADGSIPIDLAWRKPIINHKTRRGHTALYNKSIQGRIWKCHSKFCKVSGNYSKPCTSIGCVNDLDNIINMHSLIIEE
jgi:hypothetical protein